MYPLNPQAGLVVQTFEILSTSDDGSLAKLAQNKIWGSSLVIPCYVALASAVLLVLYMIVKSRRSQKIWARVTRQGLQQENSTLAEEPLFTPRNETDITNDFAQHVQQHGGYLIFAFQVLRLLACLALLVLSVYAAIKDESGIVGLFKKKGKYGRKHRDRNRPQLSDKEWADLMLSMTYLYATSLSALIIASTPKWVKVLTHHLNMVLLTFCGVYAYRDIYPLATYKSIPVDKAEGYVLWLRLCILVVSAIFVPLAIPSLYTPSNHTKPMPVPNPEQTASLFSYLTFSFLNPLVKLANKVSALPADRLPPLQDDDQTTNLRVRAFPYLDQFMSKRKEHLLLGLLRIFYKECIAMVLALVIHVCAGFASPLGIKNLLAHIETSGEDSSIRPWFWILCIFLGSSVSAIAYQFYTHVVSRTLLQVECLITQLVFEHSLRIRVKAETTDACDGEYPPVITEPVISDPIATSETSQVNSSITATQSQSTSPSTTSRDVVNPRKKKLLLSRKQRQPATGSAENLVAKISNLISTDLGNITDAKDFLLIFVFIPLQATFSIIFLHSILGWSALVGVAAIVLSIPIPGRVSNLIANVQAERMKKTDARLQSVFDTLGILRMAKLFGWEAKMADRISERREEELALIWKRHVYGVTVRTINFLIPVFAMTLTYGIFTVVMKRELTASIVFSSMSVFDMLQNQLHMSFYWVSLITAGKVSLDRIDGFLCNTELVDTYPKSRNPSTVSSPDTIPKTGIGFHKASFTWSAQSCEGNSTPLKRRFTLHIEDDLFFPQGQLSLIVGPTGSGKTSLLLALLGEMHFVRTAPDSYFSLPRAGGIAYATQESWVQNETIKNNILFGCPHDPDRYKKVIDQCGLTQDLALFEAGDETEVGEKGLTLSGGQKARITLARAVYSKAEILLLDDILAALDVHTSKWIVENCLLGDLVKGRTVLMATHNVSLASSAAAFLVSIRRGRIITQGSVSDALKGNKALLKEFEDEKESTGEADGSGGTAPPRFQLASGKLMVREELEEGHVGWEALWMYLSVFSSHSVVFVVFGYLALISLSEMTVVTQTWFLGHWAWEYSAHLPSDVPVVRNLAIYSALLLFGALIHGFAYLVFSKAAIHASRVLHSRLISSVLGTTLRWLDTTPVARILARCTQDIRAVDDTLPQVLRWLTGRTAMVLVKLVVIVALTPAFLFPSILVAIVGAYYGQVYIQAQLAVKREMSNAKQPVLGHFAAAISGLTSLRAYGAQNTFALESMHHIDRYSRATRTYYNLSRWIAIRIDMLGNLFAACLAAYLVYFQNHTASNTGFSLNMAVGFSTTILLWVRALNDSEVQGNSLERIKTYVEIEQEERPSERGIPPAYWPADGSLHVENLCARYSVEGPKVLQNISFDVNSGERIGIVGRTGSGKSSLTLALLRCIPTEGKVTYAGRDTSDLNLGALRANLTIIPQVPELLSGSLRQNIDLFGQYDDATLNDALAAAGLFSLENNEDKSVINLDFTISSGGGNLSVGQRQIIALARAIVRRSKCIILDEATSAIDHDTDAVIQAALRSQLANDVTVLTVAHRLQTIMDSDRIMVLDAGRLVEFDKPTSLLSDPKGKFRLLVDESLDKDVLERMAGFKT